MTSNLERYELQAQAAEAVGVFGREIALRAVGMDATQSAALVEEEISRAIALGRANGVLRAEYEGLVADVIRKAARHQISVAIGMEVPA